MIQMQKRKQARICAGATEITTRIRTVEPLSKEAGSKTPAPLVEITKNDPRARQLFTSQDFPSQELPGLLPALEKRRAHVHVKNVQHRLAQPQVCTQATSPLTSRCRNVAVFECVDRKPRQHNIAVGPALVSAVLTHRRGISEFLGKVTCLVAFPPASLSADDLLQRDEIGVQFAQDINNALRSD